MHASPVYSLRRSVIRLSSILRSRDTINNNREKKTAIFLKRKTQNRDNRDIILYIHDVHTHTHNPYYVRNANRSCTLQVYIILYAGNNDIEEKKNTKKHARELPKLLRFA